MHLVLQRSEPTLLTPKAPTIARGSGSWSVKEHARRFSHYIKRPAERLVPLAFGFCIASLLVSAWIERGEGHLTPEEGTGYWLGIAGGTMMLLLMLYPLRKRFKMLAAIGSVKLWFRMHMILGISGPALVLIHSNFKMQSLNATVATIAMLLVVTSGLVGRYLYARVHLGLYGRKAEAQSLLTDIRDLKSILGDETERDAQFLMELDRFEACLPAAAGGALASAAARLMLSQRLRQGERRLLKRARDLIHVQAAREGWTRRQRSRQLADVKQHVRLLSAAMRKTATFAVYTRLFAAWHVLHLPLFLLLIASAVMHIVAVHLY